MFLMNLCSHLTFLNAECYTWDLLLSYKPLMLSYCRSEVPEFPVSQMWSCGSFLSMPEMAGLTRGNSCRLEEVVKGNDCYHRSDHREVFFSWWGFRIIWKEDKLARRGKLNITIILLFLTPVISISHPSLLLLDLHVCGLDRFAPYLR